MLNRGLYTARDPLSCPPGGLQRAVGIEYRIGDPQRPHKIRGRTTCGDTGAIQRVKGLYLAQFDAAGSSDLLLALAGTVLSGGVAGATVALTSRVTGLDALSTILDGAHWNDRHFLVNGYDRNRVLESDGSFRYMGMRAPSTLPTVTLSGTTGAIARPSTAGLSGAGSQPTWADPDNSKDSAGASTFASVSMASANTSWLLTHFGWASDTTAGRYLYVSYWLAGRQSGGSDGGGPGGGSGGGGGAPSAGFDVDLHIEYSTDGGTNWLPLVQREHVMAADPSIQIASAALAVNSDQVQVRSWMVYHSGSGSAVFRRYDTVIQTGGTVSTTTTGDVAWAIAEYDQTRDLIGPLGPELVVSAFSAKFYGTLGLPTAAQNANTTHWLIYRTPVGGAIPTQFGLLAMVPVAETVYVDTFYPALDVALTPSANLLAVNAPNGGQQVYPLNSAPPILSWITVHRGRLVGGSRLFPRAAYYCVAGLPESWPEVYQITSFPMEDHDQLVTGLSLGDVFLFLAQDGAMALDGDFPSVEDGVFRADRPRLIAGAPGCVGPNAACKYSVRGDTGGAWVSPFGIEATDGQGYKRLTVNIDWGATVNTATLASASLWWDKDTQQIHCAYDSDGDGVNDRTMLLHMAPELRTEEGLPPITAGHYARIVQWAGGMISGVRRIYSAHADDGKVYLEDTGTDDQSNAYAGTVVPLDVIPGRLRTPEKSIINVMRAALAHTDAGIEVIVGTMEAIWTTRLDSSKQTQTRSRNVSLSGDGEDDFSVMLAGNWHEVRLRHLGSAEFALRGVDVHWARLTSSGKMQVTP